MYNFVLIVYKYADFYWFCRNIVPTRETIPRFAYTILNSPDKNSNDFQRRRSIPSSTARTNHIHNIHRRIHDRHHLRRLKIRTSQQSLRKDHSITSWPERNKSSVRFDLTKPHGRKSDSSRREITNSSTVSSTSQSDSNSIQTNPQLNRVYDSSTSYQYESHTDTQPRLSYSNSGPTTSTQFVLNISKLLKKTKSRSSVIQDNEIPSVSIAVPEPVLEEHTENTPLLKANISKQNSVASFDSQGSHKKRGLGIPKR